MTPSHGYAIENLPGEVVAAGMLLHAFLNQVLDVWLGEAMSWTLLNRGPSSGCHAPIHNRLGMLL